MIKKEKRKNKYINNIHVKHVSYSYHFVLKY